MAQWVKVLVTKPDEVSSISRMHMVGETRLPQVHHGKHIPHGYHGKHVPQVHRYFIFNYVFVCVGIHATAASLRVQKTVLETLEWRHGQL